MTDAEKDVQQALALEGYSNNYFQPIWNEFASGWDGQPCSEIACCISYLAGNLSKIYVSNYAQGLVDLFRANGRFYGANTIPQIGDFIWFDYGYGEGASHTGRVVDVSNGVITTIEGNMWVSGASYNQVAKLYYPIGDYRIYGFGRPNYTYQQVDSYSIRNFSPEGQDLPYYNNASGGGINTSQIGNSDTGNGVSGANVLNNCVGYSQGRMLEMLYDIDPSTSGNPFSMFNVSADNWIATAQNNNMQIAQTPNYGYVGVWTNGVIYHLANVETYVDNTWWITHSSYYDYSDVTPQTWQQGAISATGNNSSATNRIRTPYVQFDADKIKFKVPSNFRLYMFEFSGMTASSMIQRIPTTGWLLSGTEREIDIDKNYYYRFVIARNNGNNITPSDFNSVGLIIVGEENYGWWDFSYLHSSPNYLPDFISNDNSWSLVGFINPFSFTPTPPTPPEPPFVPPEYVKRMPVWEKIKYYKFT